MRRDFALSVFNICLGIWLVVSAFLWRHSTASRVDTILIGVACMAIALAAVRLPAVRWLYVPLAVWMFFSPWVLTLQDTMADENLVAIGVALLLAPFTVRFMWEEPAPASAGTRRTARP